MNSHSPKNRIVAAVLIISLMISTLLSTVLWSGATEVEPATEAENTTVTVSTTNPTTPSSSATTPSTAPTTPPGPTGPVPPDDSPDQEETLTEEDLAYLRELQAQRTELQKQASSLEELRRQYSDSLDGLLQQKQNIESQITLKQQEIDINTMIRDRIKTQIQINNLALLKQEQSYLTRRQALLIRFESLQNRVRTLAKTGEISMLLLLAGGDSFSDYLINLKFAERLVFKDQEAIAVLESELKEIMQERDSLEKEQAALRISLEPYVSAEHSLENSKRELLMLHDEASKIEEGLSTQINYYREQYQLITEQHASLRLQITEILKNYSYTDMIAPPVMSWPTPDCNIITSSFKERWGRWHYGVDISAWGDPTGKPIVAAADGIVIFANSDNSGFGNYVIIDHGYDLSNNRIVTLYAHCHELFVSEGDVVFGGQTTIASVGNTGNSTGPHLHFEVRVNGTSVDPVGEGYLLTNGVVITG